MIRYLATLMFAFSAVALGASGNVSKVNGSIAVEDGREAGDLSTVNGSITVGRDARVRDVETVNGAVRVEERATLRAAETVNGSITLSEGAEVAEDLSAVNGRLTLGRGARVGGRIGNVNGDLILEAARVGGGLETVNGDIHVGTGSSVEGGIRVERNGGWNWFGSSRRPRVTVEAGATVQGPLQFEREVDLYVGEGVALGPIEGVQPVRHALR